MTTALLIEWADKIDHRLGSITGRDADTLARTLRKAAGWVAAMHGALSALELELDDQIYQQQKAHDFNAPDDAEYSVNITAGMWRRVGRAIQVEDEEAPTCTLHPLGCKPATTARANIKSLWEALAAIREFVEDIAPPGSVPNAEQADDPEPMTEVQAIIKGIQALVDANKPLPKPIAIFTGES